jgi:hypothetical protein
MNKLIVLLITLITLTNVSYASFPVTANTQFEILELQNEKYNNRDPIFDKAATLSWILVLSAILFLFLMMGINTDLSGPGVLLIMFLVFAVAAVSAVIGLFSKRKWWQALITLIFILLTSNWILFL